MVRHRFEGLSRVQGLKVSGRRGWEGVVLGFHVGIAGL